MEVSRGSQFQNEPHENLAQIDPVTVARMQNNMPRPAAADERISSTTDFFAKNRIAKITETMNAKTAVHAIGTWKNKIRALSSRPGTTGYSYHLVITGTIGNSNAQAMTIVSHAPSMIWRVFNCANG